MCYNLGIESTQNFYSWILFDLFSEFATQRANFKLYFHKNKNFLNKLNILRSYQTIIVVQKHNISLIFQKR